MAKTANIPGKMVPQGGYSAFIPAPLPPTLDWTQRLMRVLFDADRHIGRLAGEGGILPNPHVLISPLLGSDAVLFSMIIGTQSRFAEFLAVELCLVLRWFA